MKILKRLLAWTLTSLAKEHAAALAKVKEKNRSLRQALKLAEEIRDQNIYRCENTARASLELEETVESLHLRIQELEREKLDLEVKAERLENAKILNEQAITLLQETITAEIERRRIERLTAQAEAQYIRQQGVTYATDQSQRHRGADQSTA